MCGFFSEWLTRANPLFSINEILNFGTAMIIQVFHGFNNEIGKYLALICSSWKLSNLSISKNNVGKFNVIQTSTVPQKSMQVSCTPKSQKADFVGLYFFGGGNE